MSDRAVRTLASHRLVKLWAQAVLQHFRQERWQPDAGESDDHTVLETGNTNDAISLERLERLLYHRFC